jgi:hypothetical protein
MAGYSVSSSTSGGALASTVQPQQSLRQQNDSTQVSRLSASTNGSHDNDSDSDNSGVQATQRVQAAQPTVNTRGQTIGATINTTA